MTSTKIDLNEWWQNAGFDTMKSVTGFSFHEFDPDDGYQDYIDYCNNIWNNLTEEEKLLAYHNVEK
jgi:hypothetical protein